MPIPNILHVRRERNPKNYGKNKRKTRRESFFTGPAGVNSFRSLVIIFSQVIFLEATLQRGRQLDIPKSGHVGPFLGGICWRELLDDMTTLLCGF
jgi:hypothetical protein